MSEDVKSIIEITRMIEIHRLFFLGLGITGLVIFVRTLQNLSGRLENRFPRYRLTLLQITTVASFCLYLFGGSLLFYLILEPPRELLLAAGGSAAVAIGFSLKDLVGSFVAGLVILFDRPFQVGDRVQFGDIYGEVMVIGLRAVRLKTLDDSIVTVPNSKFFTDSVSSSNSGALDMMVVIDFHIDLEADVQKARDLLYDTVVTSRFVFLKKPVSITASEVEVAHRLALRLKVKAYVFDVKYEKEFQSDVVMRASRQFAEYKIRRPEE